MIRKYIAVWFGLLIIAIVNGAIRESVYKQYLGDLLAHQVSTFTGIILFGVVIYYISKRWPLASSRQAWLIGFIWLTMTAGFEFLFGHYVGGLTWNRLLNDYNIFEGRLWILVLIWITIAPWIMWRWKETRKRI
jgi:hypothetical protein